jgi:RNA polymerase sigma-70 factor (ECF subfamily)
LLRLAHAINGLPDDQRRVIELHYIRALSVADVAALMQRTRPAVVGLLFRALKKLRMLLQDRREGQL